MIYIKYNSAANLGNYLFQIAYALSLSGRKEISYYVPSEIAESRIMRYLEFYPFIQCARDLPSSVFVVNERDVDLSNFRVEEGRDYLLCGYFQYPRLLCKKIILRSLKWPDYIRNAILEKYGTLFKQNETVGISVRRGDYLRLPHRHPFVGKRYLMRAVKRFNDKSIFIVCSDDIEWCKHFFNVRNFPKLKFVFVEGESVLSQLFIQAKCSHNILSNSTFSWWGAYLNENENNTTIVPSLWYGIGFKGEQFNLVLDGWIVVESRYSFAQYLHACFCILKTWCGNILRQTGFARICV